MKIDRKAVFDDAKRRGALVKTRIDVLNMDAAIDATQAWIESRVERPPPTFGEAAFFARLRATKPLGPTLTDKEVGGCQAIVAACRGWQAAWVAYALATAFHETAGTMQPIREYGRGKGRKYGVAGKHGQVAYGRGYVQLTWDGNYQRADDELVLGGRLTRDYDLALDPAIAAQIMVRGMAEGWFTAKKLADYLAPDKLGNRAQFKEARRIINGTDKADLIAGYALSFQDALAAGGLR